jgi:spermidine synthase
VIQRGRTRELRVDGTFASSWQPGRVTTGSVWDALALPVLALPPHRRRSVLILGLGGGSAARLVRALAPDASIVGVEFDAAVVRAARRHFGLGALGVEVVRGDARAYLERTRRRFDLVIDDVFVGCGDAVHKPDWLPRPGLALARRRLARGGVLVSNALDEAARVAATLCRLAPARVCLRIQDYDNRILLAGPTGLDATSLRKSVRAEPLLAETLGRLRFRTF